MSDNVETMPRPTLDKTGPRAPETAPRSTLTVLLEFGADFLNFRTEVRCSEHGLVYDGPGGLMNISFNRPEVLSQEQLTALIQLSANLHDHLRQHGADLPPLSAITPQGNQPA